MGILVFLKYTANVLGLKPLHFLFSGKSNAGISWNRSLEEQPSFHNLRCKFFISSLLLSFSLSLCQPVCWSLSPYPLMLFFHRTSYVFLRRTWPIQTPMGRKLRLIFSFWLCHHQQHQFLCTEIIPASVLINYSWWGWGNHMPWGGWTSLAVCKVKAIFNRHPISLAQESQFWESGHLMPAGLFKFWKSEDWSQTPNFDPQKARKNSSLGGVPGWMKAELRQAPPPLCAHPHPLFAGLGRPEECHHTGAVSSGEFTSSLDVFFLLFA